MKEGMLVCAIILAILETAVACSCNGFVNSKGQGECRTSFRGKKFCYVTPGRCPDEKKASKSDRFWSYEACDQNEDEECYGCYDPNSTIKCTYRGRTYNKGDTFKTAAGCNTCTCLANGHLSCTEKFCPSVSNCTTVGGPDTGSVCLFPFTFDRVTYTECTKHSAKDGKAWCSTFTDSKGNHVGGQGNWGHCPLEGEKGGCGRDQVGEWSLWGSWGTCSSSCGLGSRVRTRSCSQGLCNGSSQESQQCQGTNCDKCGTKRVRRNVNALSLSERRKLQQALQNAINSGEYEDVANFHGYPPTLCSGTWCCPHGGVNFLPWHRLYMAQMEEVLGEPLPYWDWTEDGRVPNLWESIAAPIKQGNLLSRPSCPRRDLRTVMRSSSININANDLKQRTKEALMADTFEEFSNQISDPHGFLHVSMQCEMSDLRTASYDPIFYLHHAYVDRQFAFWQELQILRGITPEEHPDHRQSLPPFNNQRFNNLQKTLNSNHGTETFDYKDKYCYEYDDLKFDGDTPEEFFLAMTVQTEGCEIVCEESCSNDGCKEVCNERCFRPGLRPLPPTPRVYVGVILPKMAPSGIHQFDLCLAGSCVFAGRVSTFGSATQNTSSPGTVDKRTHYLVEYDVTDLVTEQGWAESDSVLTARLVNSRLEVPAPVVILRAGGLGSKGRVVLGTGQQRRDYGDILDRFNII